VDFDGDGENQVSLSRRQLRWYSNQIRQIYPEGVSEFCLISFVLHSVQSDLSLCSGTYDYL